MLSVAATNKWDDDDSIALIHIAPSSFNCNAMQCTGMRGVCAKSSRRTAPTVGKPHGVYILTKN